MKYDNAGNIIFEDGGDIIYEEEYELDQAKITSLDDVIYILVNLQLRISKKGTAYNNLKSYLKPIQKL